MQVNSRFFTEFLELGFVSASKGRFIDLAFEIRKLNFLCLKVADNRPVIIELLILNVALHRIQKRIGEKRTVGKCLFRGYSVRIF